MYQTPLEKAQKSFAEAASGAFRGRDSFCKILDAISNLRCAGYNPESDKAYAIVGTTKQELQSLLQSRYRQAARENYQDSTDENFKGSGRTILEALSDLHLAPVYMEWGGLNPQLEESWEKCGIDHNDYLATYNARRIDEAARIWNLVKDPARKPASNIIALENTLTLLKEAGLDVTQEETYLRIGTTKQDFQNFTMQQKRPASGYARNLIYT